MRAGYRVSSTHCNPLGVKTDAPPGVIWDVMRCWALKHPHKRPPDPASYMGRLLAKAPELKADFSRARACPWRPAASRCSRHALAALQHALAASRHAQAACQWGFALQFWSAVRAATCLLGARSSSRQSPRARTPQPRLQHLSPASLA